jgi:hypothetical protein
MALVVSAVLGDLPPSRPFVEKGAVGIMIDEITKIIGQQ